MPIQRYRNALLTRHDCPRFIEAEHRQSLPRNRIQANLRRHAGLIQRDILQLGPRRQYMQQLELGFFDDLARDGEFGVCCDGRMQVRIPHDLEAPVYIRGNR